MAWRIFDRFKQQRRDAQSPTSGDLVSVVVEDEFGVMKILAVDAGGVHARLYVERFAHRPMNVDGATLTLAPFGPEHENPFSIGHMPLSYASYFSWQPTACGRAAVTEEELEGYRMWQDAEGGYF